MFGCPLRSTVDRSRGSARRALSGMAWLLPDGGPFRVPGADGVTGFGFGTLVDEPAIGDSLEAVAIAVTTGPPTAGGTTIVKVGGHEGPEFWRLYPQFVVCRAVRIHNKGWRLCGMKLDIGRLRYPECR